MAEVRSRAHRSERDDIAVREGVGSQTLGSDLDWRSMSAVAQRVAFAVTRNRQDAEDVSQEAVIRLFERLEVMDLTTPIEAWLITTTRNVAYDVLRRRRWEQDHLSPMDAPNEVSSTVPGQEAFEEMVAELDVVDQVRRKVEQLPPDQRQAVALTAFRGMTQGEAAAELGVPLNTLKSRVRRAIRRLRAWLAERP